jgi:hypothetical protein
LELVVLCCMLYRPVQFRASGYIWGWLFDISDSPYKFRLNSSGCVLHSPAELKFIRGAKKVQKSMKGTPIFLIIIIIISCSMPYLGTGRRILFLIILYL